MSLIEGAQRRALLAHDEPAAARVLNADGAGSAVLVCDHASNRLPRRLGTLGLAPADLEDHIAWDPGAAQVARRLSGHLDAPLVLSGYSRLAIDCNRPLDSAESIAERSAGVRVPGNRALTPEERAVRVDELFRPYHEAISGLLDRRAGRPSLLLSIHSFTPELDGQRRPWNIAISYGRDHRLAALLLKALRADGELVVGDNEPYPVDDAIDYTIPVHGEARGLPHVLVEIRQDGIATPAGAAEWARLLAAAYAQVEPAALRLTGACL
jgi:predicted N-formylglutamate amidohydrolase